MIRRIYSARSTIVQEQFILNDFKYKKLRRKLLELILDVYEWLKYRKSFREMEKKIKKWE